jgi:hypothetical protein
VPVLVPTYTPEQPTPAEPSAPLLSWTSPAGRVTSLSDHGGAASGVLVQPGILGFGMPDWTYYESTSPAFDGSSVRGHRAEAREITLPVLIFGDTRADMLARYRALVADLKPRRSQPGTLTVTARDGSTVRGIRGYYAGGMGGQDDHVAWGMRHISAAVVIRCPSPHFLGEEISQTFRLGEVGEFYPFTIPWTVSDSQVLGSVTVDNVGDADTYPVFTITGPVASANLTNTTTGQTISVSPGVDAGDVMVIDTRETRRSVIVNGTENRYGDLTADSVLWPLVEGPNDIALEMPGADQDSALTVAYQLRYLTAY